MKIEFLNRESIRQIAGKVDRLLSDLGLNVRIGNIGFTPHDARFTVTVSLPEKGSDGRVLTPEESAFLRYCSNYGMSPSDLYRVFESDGKKYVLCGLDTNARKYPICAEEVFTGMPVRMSMDKLQNALGLPATNWPPGRPGDPVVQTTSEAMVIPEREIPNSGW